MDASVLSSSQHAPDGGAERSSSRDGAHVPFQATNETERGVWRYFESYKRSAILHAEQYLRYSTVGQDDQGSFVDAGPPGPVALPDKQAASKVWDRKAAQDDLHEDLQVLQSLSDHMQHVSKKGLSKFYILVAILSITTSLSSSHNINGPKKLWTSSLVALSAASSYAGYRTFKFSVVYLCSEVINSLRDRLDDNTLDERDKVSLEGRRFQLLWWIYHLTASETESP